jgi:FixJ family two-component response regulator
MRQTIDFQDRSDAQDGKREEPRALEGAGQSGPQLQPAPTVFVIDDDRAMLTIIEELARDQDLHTEVYMSSEEFLQAYEASRPGCVIVDFSLPGKDGFALQKELAEQDSTLPVIMISGYASVRMAVDAMAQGAITLLQKPFSANDLFEAIEKALRVNEVRRNDEMKTLDAKAKVATLTAKGREMLVLVAMGTLNKQIAAKLNLTVRGVEDRRARMMKTLGAKSLAEVIQIARAASLPLDSDITD